MFSQRLSRSAWAAVQSATADPWSCPIHRGIDGGDVGKRDVDAGDGFAPGVHLGKALLADPVIACGGAKMPFGSASRISSGTSAPSMTAPRSSRRSIPQSRSVGDFSAAVIAALLPRPAAASARIATRHPPLRASDPKPGSDADDLPELVGVLIQLFRSSGHIGGRTA